MKSAFLLLSLFLLLGAQCVQQPKAVECQIDRDCDDGEQCDDNQCVAVDDDDDDGGEGEGEVGLPPGALAAYCDNVSGCLSLDVQECVEQITSQVNRVANDPTCAVYRGLIPPVLACFAAASCEALQDGSACPNEIEALNRAGVDCEALAGEGEGEEGEGEEGEGEGGVCDGVIGSDDGCDCGCGEHDPDCDAVGGGCDVSGCGICSDPPDATGCEFCN